MANPKVHYDFDRFAEFLCVTLAENTARCQLGLNKVQKVRIFTHSDQLWPVSFKVILDNELVAPPHPSLKPNQDASYDIQYYYRCPSSIPVSASEAQRITDPFILQAKALDAEFYADAWSFNMPGCLPYLLKDMAFRNVSRNLARQLKHQGIEISDDFSVQFHNGENFLSFNYDSLVQQIQQQIQFYLSHSNVKQLAADMCFAHAVNKQWFMGL
ncbi:MAG: hypothetical protein HWE18_01540 [Gammaproteobacteria bacterium]|nr:hypothetical protein [Gammaproteobacteria bacterium]